MFPYWPVKSRQDVLCIRIGNEPHNGQRIAAAAMPKRLTGNGISEFVDLLFEGFFFRKFKPLRGRVGFGVAGRIAAQPLQPEPRRRITTGAGDKPLQGKESFA